MSRTTRKRLDLLLVERALAPSRARAQALIMAGKVRVSGKTEDKAGVSFLSDAPIEISADPNPFVSRGGLKLAAALEAFAYDPDGLVVIDVGASTGGFTDCLLAHGAARVYALDVGYGQLSWKLRQDPRVVVMERLNARHIDADTLPEKCDLAVIDVSFISTSKVIPAVLQVLKPTAEIIVLIKPQFEAESQEVGKGGVVRDNSLRLLIIERAISRLSSLDLLEFARIDSPIAGPKGNVEALVLFRRNTSQGC